MCQQCVEFSQELCRGWSDEEIHDALWGRTCFPMGSVEEIKRQLTDYVAAVTLGLHLCGWCENEAQDGMDCPSCQRMFAEMRAETVAQNAAIYASAGIPVPTATPELPLLAPGE